MRCPSSYYSSVELGSLKLDGNLFLAPIAGYSDVVFRTLCVAEGASFTFTEMVSTEAFVRDSKKTVTLLKKAENESSFAVQLFGSSPEVVGEAAKMIAGEYNPSCIDLNAGCPMKKITKTGAGSALLANPNLLYDILKNLVDAMLPYDIPVTVKIRSGIKNAKLLWREVAKLAVDAGVKAITIHPRTQEQGYSGKSDWHIIAQLKQEIASYDVKVFGSGDLFSPNDAKQMFENTKCDGIMFARGAIGNPFIFRMTRSFLETGTYHEIPIRDRVECAKKELFLLSQLKGEKLACLEMRKRSIPYIKGISSASHLRKQLVHCSTIVEYTNILDELLTSV